MKPILAASLISLFASTSLAEAPLELTTFWNTPGELEALNELLAPLTALGYSPEVVNAQSYDELRDIVFTRHNLSSPPDISHWLWGEDLFRLANVMPVIRFDPPKASQNWGEIVYPEVVETISQEEQLLAIPIGVHLQMVSIYNMKILREAGYDTPPKTWDEFFEIMDAVKELGYRPMAISGDFWYIRQLFEMVVASMGQSAALNDIIADFDRLGSAQEMMEAAFDIIFKMREFENPDAPLQGWDLLNKTLDDESAVSMLGDYVHAELRARGEETLAKIHCAPNPGKKVVMFGVDTLVIFDNGLPNWDEIARDYSAQLLSEEVQRNYVNRKGGMPVISKIEEESLSQCSQNSMVMWEEAADERVVASIRDSEITGKLNEILPLIWANKELSSVEAAEAVYLFLKGEVDVEDLGI